VSSNKIASVILSLFIFLAPVSSFSQSTQTNVVANVEAGEVVPFDGILMSHDVAADMIVELEYAHETCSIKMAEQQQINIIEYEHKLNQCEFLKKIETDRLSKLNQVKQQRIDFLEKRWSPAPWYETPTFWYATGFTSGIILTAGIAYLFVSMNN
jgi:hypothetical protein